MKNRERPLMIPPADLPYMSVVTRGVTYYLRVPSLLVISRIGQAIDRGSMLSMFSLAAAVASGQSLIRSVEAARQGGPQVIELLGCLIGIAWADPAVELETVKPTSWTAESVSSYGSAVYEELHEAGWTLSQELALGLALMEQIGINTSIEEAVQEKARFLGRTTGSSSVEPSTPNAPSSAASLGESSTN